MERESEPLCLLGHRDPVLKVKRIVLNYLRLLTSSTTYTRSLPTGMVQVASSQGIASTQGLARELNQSRAGVSKLSAARIRSFRPPNL